MIGLKKFSFDKESIYFNYASTSYPKSKVALDSFYQALMRPPAPRRNQSNWALDHLRERVGKNLGISSDFVFFTQGATLGLNQVILGFISPGQIIAFDNRSHNAVIRSCMSMEEKGTCFAAELYDEDDQLNFLQLAETVAKKPDLLCLSHISNVNGTIYPVEQVIDFFQVHSPTTSILIDASQSAGYVSLSSLSKADFIVFPSHKHLHSVPGAAVVVAKKPLRPIVFGGTGSDSLSTKMAESNERFSEAGTHQFPAIYALVDSLEYAESMLSEHKKQEELLLNLLWDGLQEIPELIPITPHTPRHKVGIVALETAFGLPEFHWVPFLDKQKIHVRGGIHCSPLHHKQLGLSQQGSLRISLGWGSTERDIERLLYALKEFGEIAQRVFDVAIV